MNYFPAFLPWHVDCHKWFQLYLIDCCKFIILSTRLRLQQIGHDRASKGSSANVETLFFRPQHASLRYIKTGQHVANIKCYVVNINEWFTNHAAVSLLLWSQLPTAWHSGLQHKPPSKHAQANSPYWLSWGFTSHPTQNRSLQRSSSQPIFSLCTTKLNLTQ